MKIDEIATTYGPKATAITSLSSAIGGMTLGDWAALIGIIMTVAVGVTTIYYKRKEAHYQARADARAEEEHRAKMADRRRGLPDDREEKIERRKNRME